MKIISKKPIWLRKKSYFTETNQKVRNLLKQSNIHTVCEEARCPNKSECFDQKTATFLIMGKVCTRNCLFCSIETSNKSGIDTLPHPIDTSEPNKIADWISVMKLSYVVITSVTRDDLNDGGASHFVKTLEAIKKVDKKIKTEVLTPDLKGKRDSIAKIVLAKPNVYNHNVETVERITSLVRGQGSYCLSLSVIEQVKKINSDSITKTGVMLGLGETEKEMVKLFGDLKNVGCDILTMGQYLQPTKRAISVQQYVPEERFDQYRNMALDCGIPVVSAAPFVRSSYKAYESYMTIVDQR